MLKRGIELLVLSVKISCKFGLLQLLLFELLSTKNSKMRIGNLNTMKIFLHIYGSAHYVLHYTRNREAISGDGKYLKSAKKKFFNEKRMKLLCVIWDFSSAW